MPVTPYIRSPLSDLTGPLLTHQNFGQCGNLEMQVIHCYENYGKDLASRKCADIIDDYKECFLKQKQVGLIYFSTYLFYFCIISEYLLLLTAITDSVLIKSFPKISSKIIFFLTHSFKFSPLYKD